MSFVSQSERGSEASEMNDLIAEELAKQMMEEQTEKSVSCLSKSILTDKTNSTAAERKAERDRIRAEREQKKREKEERKIEREAQRLINLEKRAQREQRKKEKEEREIEKAAKLLLAKEKNDEHYEGGEAPEAEAEGQDQAPEQQPTAAEEP